MRRLITYPCAGETLVGSLDAAAGTTGLLIVSGGNEIRCGAHRGMAALASRLAADGVPVFRFDRRGIGDSTGENGGFETSADDIKAAAATFRAQCPHLTRLVGFGNCDAASALALFGREAGLDRLILANPWVIAPTDDLPPADAIRARYAEKLRDPRAWLRLIRGGVDLSKLASGLGKIFGSRSPEANPLEQAIFAALATHDATIILAERDATAIAFRAAAKRRRYPGSFVTINTASHSFARTDDKAALYEAIRVALG
ncbi:MAG: hydrolase 1, exosortase A system-associated [Sphingomonas sp.]|nr:hydrolase 1, exosortase A system-associated [Sphingomonas sp.]